MIWSFAAEDSLGIPGISNLLRRAKGLAANTGASLGEIQYVQSLGV
jgi:hypothetical protein